MNEKRMNLLLVAATASTILFYQEVVYSFHHPLHINVNSLHHCNQNHHCDPTSKKYVVENNKRWKSLLFSSVQGDQNGEQNLDNVLRNEKTLYEILNSTPDATRADLKRNYIALVRQTHPDALLSNNNNNNNSNIDDSSNNENPEFQEIMQAWKILSNPFDRKRYDRKLRAAAFTSQVENAVDAFGRSAGPQFLSAFENVAIPFMRKSAATTRAGFKSIGDDIANYGTSNSGGKESGLGGIIANAVKSGQKAGKVVDCLELLEKSRELKKRAKKETEKAQKLRETLDETMKKRVELSLHTPNVGMNSLEAMMILDGMNTTDELTMADIIRLRHTITYEIEQLQMKEAQFQKCKEKNDILKNDVEQKTIQLEQAKANAEAALQAEERAKKALDDAKNLVVYTKRDLEESMSALSSPKTRLASNEAALEKIFLSMSKQQERVRIALRRKDDEIDDTTTDKMKGDVRKNEVNDSTETIKKLLNEEKYLRAESNRLDAKAERIISRAQKLEDKANEIEKGEEEAWVQLEEVMKMAQEASEQNS